MNIHFIIDNQYSKRFILYMNEHYDVEKNKFYVVNRNRKLMFLDGIENVNVVAGNSIMAILNMRKIVRNEKDANIFIHYLGDKHLFPLFFKGKKQISYWIVWGGDLYSYIDFPLFDKETAKVVKCNEHLSFLQSIMRIFRTYIIRHKVDCLCLSPYEYELLTSFYKVKPKRVNFKYPNPVIINKIENCNLEKNNHEKIILVGNSGAEENNHIDSFIKLSQLSGNFKVIVPLSYACEENYREIVIQKGKEIFGNKFVPLLDFMNPEQYLELLLSVDVAVMNHFRQQAVGNMRTLITLGKKIYLNETNPMYNIFRQNGVYLSPMPKEYFDERIFEEYSEEQKNQNIKGLESFYSDELIAEYMDALFK